MNRRLSILSLALVVALVAPQLVIAQEGAAPDAAVMAAMSPSEHHKHLEYEIGNWNTKMKMWTAPGQPPMESNGTAESHWILGGRYVESVYKSDIMGMAFEGHAIDGYDNLAKEYQSVWVDNMGTGIILGRGTCSDGGKVHTNTNEAFDPMSGKKVKSRMVITSVDANTYRVEMFMLDPAGKETKSMEVVATRKQ